MIEMEVGGEVVRVRATPLSLLFYRQEFDRDMLTDLVSVLLASVASEGDDVELDVAEYAAVIRLVWAMAKSEAFGSPFPSFTAWVASFEEELVLDDDFIMAALEVAAAGCFRDERNAGRPIGEKRDERHAATGRPPVARGREARRARLRGAERAALSGRCRLRGRPDPERGQGARGDASGHRLVPVLEARL